MRETYRCPDCHGSIKITGNDTGVLCSGCGFSADIVSGVPVFFSLEETSGKLEEPKTGLSEKLFSSPRLYNMYAGLKNRFFTDSAIGVSEYVMGQDIIDIGCGPSLKTRHAEYNAEDARSVTATDVSLEFVLQAKQENPSEKFEFAVASIDKLPYPDKSFDTSLVSFVIHHVPLDNMNVMDELIRVTRNTIIIFDHLRSDSPIKSAVQMNYWKYLDGGCNYLSDSEWNKFLEPVTIMKKVNTGAIFGHVVKYICRIDR